MFEHTDFFKFIADLLSTAVVAVVAYLFNAIRKLKDDMTSMELKVAKEYLTKSEFREFEAKIFDKIDEHKEESIRQHTEITTKLAALDSKLFATIVGKNIDNS